MAEAGFISLQEPARPRMSHRAQEDRGPERPYFVEFVRQQLEARYGSNAVYKGGLAVYTTWT